MIEPVGGDLAFERAITFRPCDVVPTAQFGWGATGAMYPALRDVHITRN